VDTGPDSCIAGFEIEDCSGGCGNPNHIGDGVCDDGINTDEDFMCVKYNFDDGDCDADTDASDDSAEEATGITPLRSVVMLFEIKTANLALLEELRVQGK
jgi:hypothetical protein